MPQCRGPSLSGSGNQKIGRSDTDPSNDVLSSSTHTALPSAQRSFLDGPSSDSCFLFSLLMEIAFGSVRVWCALFVHALVMLQWAGCALASLSAAALVGILAIVSLFGLDRMWHGNGRQTGHKAETTARQAATGGGRSCLISLRLFKPLHLRQCRNLGAGAGQAFHRRVAAAPLSCLQSAGCVA